MKIAVLGNSHAGPVYTAYKNYRKDGGTHTADFFIERSMATDALEIGFPDDGVRTYDDIKILPSRRLDVASYDAVVVIGLGLGFHTLVSLYGRYRADSQTVSETCQLISDHCYATMLVDVFAATKAGRIIDDLVKSEVEAVCIVPQPFSAEWVRVDAGRVGALYRTVERNDDAKTLLADFNSYLGSLGSSIKVLRQPEFTVTADIYTRNSFVLGDPADIAPDSYFARGDFFHGNQHWGREVWGSITASFSGNN